MARADARAQLRWRTARLPQAAGGFTLVELLASIGIIIFVLSLAILAVGPALRAAGTKDAARRLRATLDAARIRAIQQRRMVRFETQRANNGTAFNEPEQWGATPNAGDPTHEWHSLPDLVRVQTNAGSSDVHSGYRTINALAISFGPDASVKAISYREGSDLETWTDLGATDVEKIFRIRLHTVRDAPDEERRATACFIEITPLTGLITSFGYEEYKEYGKVTDDDFEGM